MAALTGDRNTPTMGDIGKRYAYPIAASTKIYKGSLVALNAAGNATPGAVSTTLSVGLMALETKDNSTGAIGDLSIECCECVARFANGSSITKTSIGHDAYYLDDQTVSNVATAHSIAGTIAQVDSLGVWVKLAISAVAGGA